MNDFQFQRRLRQLAAPHVPQTDLWPAIAARIATDTAAARRRSRLSFAAAAALLLAVGTGVLMLGLRPQAMPTTAAMDSAHMTPREARAGTRAPGGDPRLLGAAVVLDAAHAELEQALGQRPDAVFLVSLLNHTQSQRLKLDHFGANAG